MFGGYAGIGAISATDTKIFNAGDFSAGSDLAIVAFGAGTEIYNTGRITGFVALTDEGDTFLNQKGGVFETKLVSDFGGGSDLFQNQGGGTVQAATNRNAAEKSSFVNLERFSNAGLISLVDGATGDIFRISNAPPQPAASSSTAGLLSTPPATRRWGWMRFSAAQGPPPTVSSSTAM